MKAVSCILWTTFWITALALISQLAEVAGTITAAISVVTVVGLIGSLAILLREEHGFAADEQPVEQPAERATAEVVSNLSVHPSRLALPAPREQTLTRLNR